MPLLVARGRSSALSSSSICCGVNCQSEISTVSMSAAGSTGLPKKSTVTLLQSKIRSVLSLSVATCMSNESESE